MEYEKIYNTMLVVFAEDLEINGDRSYITDLTIISIKSLVPSRKYVKVNIDYNRYNEEIKLWQYYRNGDNPSLLNLFQNIDSKIYWGEIDDSVYSRVLPITIVNKDFDDIREEIIKNLLFTTGNIETLIETILISKMIFLLINNSENIIEELKEEIINFSQLEFERKYAKYYRIPTSEYKKNYTIDFEQKKIFALNLLNFSTSPGFKTLKDCLEVLLSNGIGRTTMGKCIKVLLDNNIGEIDIDAYYKELSSYLYKLRNGKIAPEVLEIEKYYLPNIFQFNEGEVFYHSLLNKCLVMKKQEIGNDIIIDLNTKSGIYRFKKTNLLY